VFAGGVLADDVGVPDVGVVVVSDAWGGLVLSPLVVDEGLSLPPPPHAANKTLRRTVVVLNLVRDIFTPMTKKLPDYFL
jgi:hypothetical protein